MTTIVDSPKKIFTVYIDNICLEILPIIWIDWISQKNSSSWATFFDKQFVSLTGYPLLWVWTKWWKIWILMKETVLFRKLGKMFSGDEINFLMLFNRILLNFRQFSKIIVGNYLKVVLSIKPIFWTNFIYLSIIQSSSWSQYRNELIQMWLLSKCDLYRYKWLLSIRVPLSINLCFSA